VSCKHEVLATQLACPECGHIDPERVIVGWARDRGLRSRWKATLITLAMFAIVVGSIVVTWWLVGVVVIGRGSLATIIVASLVAGGLFAVLALKGRDIVRRTLFHAPEWFVEWRLTEYRLTLGESSLDLMHVTAAACESPNRAGHCLIMIASDVLRLDGTPLWRLWSGSDEGRSRAICKEILVRTARRRERRRLPPLDASNAERISTALAAYKLK
jgi:hypothetical protein